MTSLETYFNNSQPLDQYIAAMTENKENLESIYQSFSLPNNDQRLDQLKTSNFDILTLNSLCFLSLLQYTDQVVDCC